MKRMPKEKVALYVYISHDSKKKLDCLKKLFALGDKPLSFAKIVEESINFLYFVAYQSQKSSFWSKFFRLFKDLLSEEALNDMVGDVMKIVKEKKHSAKEVLTVDVSFADSKIKYQEKLKQK